MVDFQDKNGSDLVTAQERQSHAAILVNASLAKAGRINVPPRKVEEFSELIEAIRRHTSTAVDELRLLSTKLDLNNNRIAVIETTVAVSQEQTSAIHAEVNNIRQELRGSETVPALSARMLLLSRDLDHIREDIKEFKAQWSKREEAIRKQRWQLWMALIGAGMALAVALLEAVIVAAVRLPK